MELNTLLNHTEAVVALFGLLTVITGAIFKFWYNTTKMQDQLLSQSIQIAEHERIIVELKSKATDTANATKYLEKELEARIREVKTSIDDLKDSLKRIENILLNKGHNQ